MRTHRLCSASYSQISFAAILCIAVGLNVHGQTWTQYDQGTPPQHAAGVSPVGSYISADLGTVNLGNGSLNLSLPLGSVGGRGFSIPLSLNYSSKVWSVAHDEAYDPRRRQYFNMAYASYGAEESYVDIYSRLAPGWTISGVPMLKRTWIPLQPCQQTSAEYALTKLTVVLPDKGEIELRDEVSNGAPLYLNCTPNEYRGRRWHATDGSGAIFISDNDNGVVNNDSAGTLITADGTRYQFQNPLLSGGYGGAFGRCVSITDRNGNQILINHFNDPNNLNHIVTDYTDQLGRTVKVEEQAPDPANPSIILPLLVTLRGYQGTLQYYKVKTDLLSNHIRSDFNYTGEQILTGYDDPWGTCFQGGQPPPATYVFPTSYCTFKERIDNKTQVTQLILPDGRSLQFKYNLHGEMAEVVLPTGARMEYDYSGNTGGFPAGNTLPMEYQAQGNAVHIDRAVSQRRTYPDGATLEGTFTYGFAPQTVNGTSYACADTRVFAGTMTSGTLLSHQRHFFLAKHRYLNGAAGSVSGTGYTSWTTGVEWRTEVLDESGNVISATQQEWERRTPVVWTSGYGQQEIANDNRTIETRRYLDDGSFAKTETIYDDVNYPRANNISEVREYDFDQSFKRLSRIIYKTGPYQTDETIHLVGLVLQRSVYSDSGGTNEVARTVNQYDIYVDDTNNYPLEDRSVVVGHDNNYGTGKVTRGNLTGTGRWLKTNDTTIYSYLRYDTLGNPVSNKDAKGNVTTLTYGDNFGDGSNPANGSIGNYGATYALPTLITSPAPTPGAPVHTAYTQYDFWSGQLTGFKARNGIISQTIYNDPFSRPTLVKSALGTGVETHAAMYYAPATAFGITLSNNDVLTAKDQTSVNDATLRAWTHTDGFGRTIETWTRAPEGNVKVATDYDALGRVRQQSNPFRPSPPLSEPAVYTTTAYDLAGRMKSVTSPGGAVVNTYYSGSKVLVKDQSERERLSQTNALGQLTDVWEILALEAERNEFQDSTELITFPNHSEVVAGFRTKYAYDTVGNLTTTTQQKGTTGTIQTRTFVYNSLSQLTDATNPESGHIIYDYDPNGNLWHKTDARLITATYEYDALNRNKSIVYSNDPADTPTVTRSYDGATNGKGRLWKTETGGANGSRTTINSFDPLGRPGNQSQQFYSGGAWSQSYTLQRTYDLLGHPLTQTYPSGHTVNYAYDAAGRTSSFTGNLGEGVPRTYADDFQYTAMGGIQQEKFGTDTALYHKQRFNERGQLWDMRLSTVPYSVDPGNDDRGSLINYYSSNFAPGGSGADNNGNLLRQQIFIPGSGFFQDDFVYDSLNRLKSISEKLNGGDETFKQAYTFDRWGNRTIDQANIVGDVPHPAFTVNAANNRLNAPAGHNLDYDEAGNLIDDSSNQKFAAAIYDAENRLAQVSNAPVCFPDGEGGQICNPSSGPPSEYVYDGDGRRVRRLLGGPFVQDETWQVYGFDGELLSEYPRSGTPVIAQPQKEYGYRDGQLLVTAEPWTNIALNRPASQINNYSAINMAAKAVNGDANGVLGEGATSATNSNANSWWQVDLQSVQTIDSITVWGRTDCCPQQTSDFYLLVSDVPFTSYDLNTTLAQPGVSNYYHAGFSGPSPSAGPTSINVNRTGRYVRVQLFGTNHLVLGEVQVWSQAAKVNWLVTDHLGTARIIVDKTGSLAGVSRHDYFPFGEELLVGRTTTPGYGLTDGVRQKFTAKERDNETGLDYFGARYYGSTQGRFTSADPLYLEMKRLIDPQQLNLYQYTRNNPMRFTDPSGLDITVSGDAGNDYIIRLQKRTPSFKVVIKDGRVNIVNEKGEALDKKALDKLGKTLSGGEKELFNAITDKDHHVTIKTSSKADPTVDFGRFDGKGTNTLDFADINQLGDAPDSQFDASQVVAHETLEAYDAAKTGATDSKNSHNYANEFFGGLDLPVGGVPRIGGGAFHDVEVDLPIHNNPQFRLRLTRDFLTPIPVNAIPSGHIPAHIRNPKVINNCGP